MTDQDDPSNVISLVDRRAQAEEDSRPEDDEGDDDFDAGHLVSVVDEGECSFVLVSMAAADNDGLEPDECDELALALIRAGVRVRMLRGET